MHGQSFCTDCHFQLDEAKGAEPKRLIFGPCGEVDEVARTEELPIGQSISFVA
jgi:hypothetical protein